MPILLRATEIMPFLSFDEDSFSWFHSEGIMSVNVDAARAFYKSIAHLLVREEMPGMAFILPYPCAITTSLPCDHDVLLQ